MAELYASSKPSLGGEKAMGPETEDQPVLLGTINDPGCVSSLGISAGEQSGMSLLEREDQGLLLQWAPADMSIFCSGEVEIPHSAPSLLDSPTGELSRERETDLFQDDGPSHLSELISKCVLPNPPFF